MNRIVSEPPGVVRVQMPAGKTEEALRQQVLDGVPHFGGLPILDDAARQPVDQAVPPLGRFEQDRVAVGTRLLLIEDGDEWVITEREQSVVSSASSTQMAPSWRKGVW